MANVGDEIQVQHRCQVTFAIDKDYKDTVWYDVPSMVNGDILLGRLWMYDKNRTHGMHDNTYTFAQNGKHVTLHPMKPGATEERIKKYHKNFLQVHIVYRSNIKKYQVRGRTLSNLWRMMQHINMSLEGDSWSTSGIEGSLEISLFYFNNCYWLLILIHKL